MTQETENSTLQNIETILDNNKPKGDEIDLNIIDSYQGNKISTLLENFNQKLNNIWPGLK